MHFRPLIAGLLLFPLPASAATSWDIATGMDYSVGKYGAASDTTVISVPLGVRVQMDQLRLEATLPYVWERGPGNFADGVVVPGGSSTIMDHSGIGDANLGAAWILHPDDASFFGMELAGNVKVPTADSHLGTGKADYGLQVNLNHNLTPSFMLFGSLGYQWLNNFRTFHLEDGITASAGVNQKLGDATDIGVSLAYREPYYAALSEQLAISPYVLFTVAPRWRISAYATAGFTNASPSAGGGFRLIFAP
jgi:hypothetical protein